MRLGKVLKGLVIVLCAVLVCAPAAAVDPVTCLFDFDEDGDIDGRDLVYFAAGFDGNDLDLFAEFFGNGGCQPLSSAPPDVDWGIAVDEQQVAAAWWGRRSAFSTATALSCDEMSSLPLLTATG